jgi:hypothetical protein
LYTSKVLSNRRDDFHVFFDSQKLFDVFILREPQWQQLHNQVHQLPWRRFQLITVVAFLFDLGGLESSITSQVLRELVDNVEFGIEDHMDCNARIVVIHVCVIFY